ncbi:DUF2512 family protein [Paenibacillus ihumii]|uniref:DUF2512 family protein n=1 Tax=Paenibacillus ihumii TaxID=687436 RepID=UPI0006D85377|nr:DUF2512 family protein [Paenibacillus ihumii]
MTKRILIKTVWSCLILVGLFMLTSNASFFASLLSALGLAAFSFLLVDLFVLPRATNALATMIDAVLAYLFIWALAANNGWSMTLPEVLTITLVLTVFEYFYHDWLIKNGIQRDRQMKVE